MADLADQKARARKAAFARRKAAQHPDRDARANRYLRALLVDHAAQPISGYMAIRTEIDPMGAMAAHCQGAPVAVPVITGENQPLEFHRWGPDIPMKAGPFGAQVPVRAELIRPRVVILPLVAFDRSGRRLGYGGGFYDRTLQGLRDRAPVLAVGFAYGAQEAQDLPVEPTDQPMDAVVTEAGIRWF